MPHFTIEYSANLEPAIDVAGLCLAIHKTIMDTGLFELGAVRVRAFRAEAFAIADLVPENGFIDMSFRIGAGRSDDDKQRTGEAIIATVANYVGPLFKTPHFALSLEVREIDPKLSWKKNSIHARLRSTPR